MKTKAWEIEAIYDLRTYYICWSCAWSDCQDYNGKQSLNMGERGEARQVD